MDCAKKRAVECCSVDKLTISRPFPRSSLWSLSYFCQCLRINMEGITIYRFQLLETTQFLLISLVSTLEGVVEREGGKWGCKSTVRRLISPRLNRSLLSQRRNWFRQNAVVFNTFCDRPTNNRDGNARRINNNYFDWFLDKPRVGIRVLYLVMYRKNYPVSPWIAWRALNFFHPNVGRLRPWGIAEKSKVRYDAPTAKFQGRRTS